MHEFFNSFFNGVADILDKAVSPEDLEEYQRVLARKKELEELFAEKIREHLDAMNDKAANVWAGP